MHMDMPGWCLTTSKWSIDISILYKDCKLYFFTKWAQAHVYMYMHVCGKYCGVLCAVCKMDNLLIFPTCIVLTGYVVTAMFPVGSVSGRDACVSLIIMDDNTLDGIETLNVSLAIVDSGHNNVNLGSNTTGTVTIRDDESMWYLWFCARISTDGFYCVLIYATYCTLPRLRPRPKLRPPPFWEKVPASASLPQEYAHQEVMNLSV